MVLRSDDAEGTGLDLEGEDAALLEGLRDALEKNRLAWDGYLTPAAIHRWLAQFDRADRPLALRLLRAFHFYSASRTAVALTELRRAVTHRFAEDFLRDGRTFSDAQIEARRRLQRCIVVPVQAITRGRGSLAIKSGQRIAYDFAKHAPKLRTCVTADRIKDEMRARAFDAVLACDDFVGTADQARNYWKGALAPALDEAGVLDRVPVVLAVIAGMDAGIEALEAEGLPCVAVDRYGDGDRVFVDASEVTRAEERTSSRETMRRYGLLAHPRYPLGYEESQLLIGFAHMIPDNTLAVFWARSGKWLPLMGPDRL